MEYSFLDFSKRTGHLWMVEPVEESSGGCAVEWGTRLRLRHILTGLYLGMDPMDYDKLTDESSTDIGEDTKKSGGVGAFFRIGFLQSVMTPMLCWFVQCPG